MRGISAAEGSRTLFLIGIIASLHRQREMW